MRATCSKFVLLGLMAVSFAQHARAHDLKPGLYEIQVVEDRARGAQTLMRCISASAIERHDPFEVFSAFPQTDCLKLPMCFGNGKAGFDIVCAEVRPDKASARFRFSQKQFSGTVELTREENGRVVTFVETQQGRRIGPCEGAVN